MKNYIYRRRSVWKAIVRAKI